MKTRLGIFIAALLILPFAGLYLSGAGWSDLPEIPAAGNLTIAASLLTSLILAVYVLLCNSAVKHLAGNSPLKAQRPYFIGVSLASVVLCYLFSYLNLFVASVPQPNLVSLLQNTLLFALLAPAILVTRALLGSKPVFLKFMTFRTTFPAANDETLARLLLAVAIFSLLGGAAWPGKLNSLMWSSPLLLLTALQLLWHESSIFTAAKSGDFGRLAGTALSGMLVGNLVVFSFQRAFPALLAQAGFILFALTCLQLADVVAENWRGKSRTAMFAGKKKFPIPVIVKKI